MIDFDTNNEPPVWALVLLMGTLAFAAICVIVVLCTLIGYVFSKGWV